MYSVNILRSQSNRWYPLKSKPGQESKNKQRGEIEVRVAFTVKSGSLLDLSKKEKHKGSLGHIAQAAHHFGKLSSFVRECMMHRRFGCCMQILNCSDVVEP